MTDVSDDVRKLAALLAQTVERVGRLESAGSGFSRGHMSIEDAAVVEKDADGNVVSEWGKHFDGTHGTVTLGGPPPPAPTGMVVEATAGGLTVGWAGAFADDAVAPMDFARVEVHASTEPGFTPDRDSIRASFESAQGGQAFVPLPPDEHEVCLVARATHGKPSAPSAREAVTPLPLIDAEDVEAALASRLKLTRSPDAPAADGEVDGELWWQVDGGAVVGQWRWDTSAAEWVPEPISGTLLAAETVGADQVAAGAVAAKHLTADLALLTRVIAGDPTGGRVELGPFGLRKYAADGTTVDVDMTGPNAIFRGLVEAAEIVGPEIIGGSIRTAASGQRITIADAYPSDISFHTGHPSQKVPGMITSSVFEGFETRAGLTINPPNLGSSSHSFLPTILLAGPAPDGPTVYRQGYVEVQGILRAPVIEGIQSGSTIVSTNSGGDGTQTVQFASGRFPTAPNAVATIASGAGAWANARVRVASISTTGFTLVVNGGAASSSTTVQWVAVA